MQGAQAPPTARAAAAAAATQRGATALSPGSAAVTSHSWVASPPCSSTRGTVMCGAAHRSRTTSAAIEVSSFRGAHLM